MRGRASDLIAIPGSFWQRAETMTALHDRAIGQLFDLLRKYAGASQTQIGIACGMSQSKISDIIRGIQQVETLAVFERIADALDMPGPARITLGLAPRQAGHARQRAGTIPAADTRPASNAARAWDLLSLDPGDEREDEDPVRRRTFVGLAGASIFTTMLTGSSRGNPAVICEPFAPVLTGHTADAPAPLDGPPDIAVLAAAVNNARRQYQACQYSGLIKHLPSLLARLHDACLTLAGEARLRACSLSADAHHVAAGLLLKLDDQGLAYLAADRSMRAAQASQDPITVGASARIITHTLMSGHHLAAAVSTASTHARRLDQEVPSHSPESLSVYGSLLLRGPSPLLTTTSAPQPMSCSPKQTTLDGGWGWMATCAGLRLAPPTPGCTASTSLSRSGTPEPPSTLRAASTSPRSRLPNGRRVFSSTPPARSCNGANTRRHTSPCGQPKRSRTRKLASGPRYTGSFAARGLGPPHAQA